MVCLEQEDYRERENDNTAPLIVLRDHVGMSDKPREQRTSVTKVLVDANVLLIAMIKWNKQRHHCEVHRKP